MSKYVVVGWGPGFDDDTSLEIEADSRDDAKESFGCQLLVQINEDRAENLLNQVDEASVFIHNVFGPYENAEAINDDGGKLAALIRAAENARNILFANVHLFAEYEVGDEGPDSEDLVIGVANALTDALAALGVAS